MEAAATPSPSSPDQLEGAARLLREAAERIERAASLLRQAETATTAEQRTERKVAVAAPPQAATPTLGALAAGPIAAAAHAEPTPATAARAIEPALAPVSPSPATSESQHSAAPAEPCPRPPIAVVALGCVLPGAADAGELWRHVLDGTSGIVDLAALDPGLGADFVARRGAEPVEIVSDKTYTLLSGAIREVRYDAARLGAFYDEPAFAALTRGQQLLASAVAQALAARPASAAAPPLRTQCILGATADGSAEYDEALFVEDVRRRLGELPLSADRRAAFAARLDGIDGNGIGMNDRGGEALRQHELYRAVVGRLVGEGVRTYVVDSACSSSLYSLALGIEALEAGEADVVIAGGVFAAGPANNTLFAQFRGLTPHASRPFDAAADGVVFGDGAAVVVLQRLPDAMDALAAGGRILGVIRGIGLSSDGKAPSVNVPQSAGQALAIRRAYASSGIPLDSIQVVEAHATATPVGDAVEVRSLAEVFAGRAPCLPRIQLGSVKALIGHTGWVSGVASLIKLLAAFAARTVPPQYNFTAPDPGLVLDASPFEISTRAREWPPNSAPWPRRAGINGFGFGGTNAHLVVEEYDEAYHRRLCAGLAPAAAAEQPVEVAVVGAAGLFPAATELAAELAAEEPGAAARFRRAALRLPAGKRLLPDVLEHMDPSQYLTALAAERIFAAVPPLLAELREEVGVVVGVEGKTERGVSANERIFLDRLRRLAAKSAPAGRDGGEEAELIAALAAHVRARVIPSGPYTLPGLMPNVAASRVSNLFALRGPNLVIDMGERSLFQAVAAAASLLAHGDCKVVLAGGLSAAGRQDDREGIAMLALTTPALARERGLPVLATLRVSDDEAATLHATAGLVERTATDGAESGGRWRAATGAAEVLRALRRASDDGASAGVAEPGGSRALVFAPTAEAAQRTEAQPAAVIQDAVLLAAVSNGHGVAAAAAAKELAEPPSPAPAPPATHAYVQGTPIETYTPV
ncbi:MAG TPA: beta-ketoacyl synthase N-terminal-like domain-containing protein, partial [Thermoanaerobaculia bacterium]|nr:beta-ketoacyl synthase N-terminal-like domain-containing protein [Thermoanaerobaculia bacterium]